MQFIFKNIGTILVKLILKGRVINKIFVRIKHKNLPCLCQFHSLKQIEYFTLSKIVFVPIIIGICYFKFLFLINIDDLFLTIFMSVNRSS